VFSVVLASLCTRAARRGSRCSFIDALSRALLRVVGLIMKTAPIAAFGHGRDNRNRRRNLSTLKLIVSFYATSAFSSSPCCRDCVVSGFSIWR
jgi:Na+/H+-dicarboxylate symporter